MKEIHLWNFIYTHLLQNNSAILIAVVNHEKGSPGKQGFKMAISSSGGTMGSIGGGVMEYNIIGKCKELLKNKTKINQIETLYHNKKPSGNRSGLICAGSQTNFTYLFSKKDIEVVRKILNAVKEHDAGKIIFTQKGISFSSNKNLSQRIIFKIRNEEDWLYEETVGVKNTVYVIGSGHVGLAVCRIMSMLDFYVVVYDSRDDLNLQTMKENIYANKKITGSYEDLGKVITKESYIVIVTTGFESDKEAIKQVINKTVKYIGLMGTKVKIKKIFNELVKDGIKKEQLEKIRAPIGIDINSGTPEEIAISIAAEIIGLKNNS